MNKEELKLFINRMVLAVRQAGAVALVMEGRVQNEGKEIQHLPNDTDILKKQRAAKTVIDEIVQEILLLSAADVLDAKKVSIDAEEKTPSTSLFSQKQTSIALVLDPIDGTSEYLKGGSWYSVCVGLIIKGEVAAALVYFPKKDCLYFIHPNGKPYVAKNVYQQGVSNVQLLTSLLPQDKRIYKNSRVSQKIVQKLIAARYQIYDETDSILWTDGIFRCLNGTFCAALFDTPQIRDVLLGAILSKTSHGYATDFEGKIIKWPQGGRIPQILFGAGNAQKERIAQALR